MNNHDLLLMEPSTAQQMAEALKRPTMESLAPWRRSAKTIRIQGTEVTIRAAGTSGDGYGVYQTIQGVAIIGVFGVLLKGGADYGYADPRQIQSAIRSAAADNSAKSIMLWVDSPGGGVSGISELATAIAEASAVKPTLAFCEDLAASAGYWAASQCRMIACNAMALVGSIGVYSTVVDASQYFQNSGIKVTLVKNKAAKLKTAGDPTQEFTDEEYSYLQNLTEQIYSSFAGSVAKARGISRASIDAMQGRVFLGKDAQAQGLVDVVADIDDAFGMCAAGAQSRGARAGAELNIEAKDKLRRLKHRMMLEEVERDKRQIKLEEAAS